MNKKIFALTLILLVFTIFISGCIGQKEAAPGGQFTRSESDIKSEKEASEAVSNMSQDVQDISSTLEDINKALK